MSIFLSAARRFEFEWGNRIGYYFKSNYYSDTFYFDDNNKKNSDFSTEFNNSVHLM